MRQRIPTAKKLLAGPAEKLCGEKSKERGTGSGAETTLLRGGAGAGLSENPLVSGVRSWDSLQAPRRGGGGAPLGLVQREAWREGSWKPCSPSGGRVSSDLGVSY